MIIEPTAASNFPFLTQAMRQFKMVVNAESRVRQDMRNDMLFESGGAYQWNAAALAQRQQDQRPIITINRIASAIKQVTNKQRAARLGVQIAPINGNADVDTAEALQGIIRAIETNSDADVAYTTAGRHQVVMGRGYWRIVTEFAEDDGYEQVIAIRRVRNALSVFMDPSAEQPDGSDARFGFVVEDLTKDEFVERYGDAAYSSWSAFMTQTKMVDWSPLGHVRIADYFYVEVTEKDVTQVEFPSAQTGQLVTEVMPTNILTNPLPDGWRKVWQRKVQTRQCKWAKITPVSILEGNDDLSAGRDFPSRYIPIVPVLGEERDLDGYVDLRGMTRDAADPCRAYNYNIAGALEVIGLAPRAPYIGAAGQFKGFETEWDTAHLKSYSRLNYNPQDIMGQPVPPPQRQPFSPNIEAFVQAAAQADNDIKATTGLYDASLGQKGPEQSGKAILERKQQGDLGTSDYLDNQSRAVRYGGRIMLDMIPRVYTPYRVLRVLGLDDQPKSIMVHTGQTPKQDLEAIAAAQGITEIYDLSVGRYDVSVSAAPSYASRRQEGTDAMLNLVQSYPAILPLVGDLMVTNMDWPGAQQIGARMKAAYNPPDPDGPNQAIPPQVAGQMKQMQAQIQHLTGLLSTEQLKYQAQERMTQMRNESNERVASYQAEAAYAQTLAKLNADKAQLLINNELTMMQQRNDQMHDASMAAAQAQTDAAAASLAAPAATPPQGPSQPQPPSPSGAGA